jgi:hypothetical protein
MSDSGSTTVIETIADVETLERAMSTLSELGDLIESLKIHMPTDPCLLSAGMRWRLEGFTDDATDEAEQIIRLLIEIREAIHGGLTVREENVREVLLHA